MASPLIWLSGAQADILANFKHDRPKYVGTGSAVLFTSAIAASSMAFALHMALKAPLAAAISFGLVWGVGILSLDRWLVASMTRRQGMLLVVPRVLLAILFSVVISTPLTLQIFNSEIAQQISMDQATAAANFVTSPSVAKLTAKVNQDESVVKGYQAVISSGGAPAEISPAKDPVLVSLQNTLAADQTDQTNDYNAYVCQEYGQPGNCSPAGNGPAATADLNRYKADTANINSVNQRIAAEETSLNTSNAANKSKAVSNATVNLSAAQAQLTADTNSLDTLKSDFNTNNTNNTGILARLKALDELRMSDLSMLVAEFVLFLFFAAIELLPVIVKLLLNRGEETQYEKAVVAADVVNLMREEYVQRTRYLDAVRQQDQLVAQSRAIQLAYEKHVMPEVTQRMTAARRQVELDKVARWEELAMLENTQFRRGWEPAGLPLLRNYRRELRQAWTNWLRWLPGGTAKPAQAPQIATPRPPRVAINSGPMQQIPDLYGSTRPQW
jgi:hypothetical protein